MRDQKVTQPERQAGRQEIIATAAEHAKLP